VAGDPANVRAPDRDVEGSPATPLSHRRCCPPRNSAGGSASNPDREPQTHRAQLHSLDLLRSPPSGVPRRWHRRCLTDRHRQRWSDDRRIPLPGAWCDITKPTAGPGDPRPAPDACSAATPFWGGGRFQCTAPPPHHFFPPFPARTPDAGDLAGQAVVVARPGRHRSSDRAIGPASLQGAPQRLAHFDQRPPHCVKRTPNRVIYYPDPRPASRRNP
jgi:hypothetical protein